MVRLRAGWAVLPLALFFGFASQITLADDWPLIAPEEQALKDVAEQPGAPVVVLNHEETYDDTNAAHTVLIYMRWKVLTEAGRDYANVNVPYGQYDLGVTNITGRTIHTDGSVVPFDGKSFTKTIFRGRGTRFQVKTFTLPDVQVGSIFEFRFAVRYPDRYLVNPRWIVQDRVFQKKVTFKYFPTTGFVELKNGQVGKGNGWTNYLPKPYAPQIRDNPIQHWFELDMTNVPAFIEEPYMPPPDTQKWRVYFYYQIGDTKPDKYWHDQGKAWNKEVEEFMGKKKSIQDALGQIVSLNDTPGARARKIYTFVSQLENRSYIPHRVQQEEKVLGVQGNDGVDDVLRQHSGSHNDLTRLFVAMARESGIPAQLMWVPDRSETIFDPQYMSTYQLNAEIAIIQLDGKEIFLDPGTKFCPFGLLDWRYSNSQGIRQSADKGTEIAASPLSTYNQALIQRTANLQLTEQGSVEGTVTAIFMGLEAMNHRRDGGKTDSEGQKKLLEDEIKGWLPGGYEVTLTKPPDWTTTTAPFLAEFKVTGPFASNAGKRWIVPLHFFETNKKAMFAAANRSQSIYFDYPYRESDEVHLTLPANMEVETLPENDMAQIEGAALYKAVYQKGPSNTIVVQRDLAMASTPLPRDMYKDVKDFFEKAKTADDRQAILKGVPHVATN
jgi:transglutaminase-like putative cysteine protease